MILTLAGQSSNVHLKNFELVRALQRHRRGHGFESPNIFQVHIWDNRWEIVQQMWGSFLQHQFISPPHFTNTYFSNEKGIKIGENFFTPNTHVNSARKKTFHLRCGFSLRAYSFKDGWRSRIKRVSFTPQPLFRVLFIPPFEILATGRFGHRPTPCTMFPCVFLLLLEERKTRKNRTKRLL